MFSQSTIKAIQDTMRRDVGVDGDAQRLGQFVWMAFLKVLDDKEYEWELLTNDYISPLPEALRWRHWAADDEGLTGDQLLAFVNAELFPSLKRMKDIPGSNAELASVVRGVFGDAYNYMKSGTLLRQVLNTLTRELNFNESGDRHEFGDAYEYLLQGLQSAGDAGEFYTPRPVTQFIVDMVEPELGEVVFDPACGTGGFLVSALAHLRACCVRSPDDDRIAQNSLRGIEKKPLPHLLCVTNLMLHGIEVPTGVIRANTLARPLTDYRDSDRVDIVVTNPPFMGMEEEGVQNNFPSSIRTRETADLFLALTIHILKRNGRAAIVLPDSSLFGEDVKQVLRKRLLEETDLHSIVRLPHGTFSPYTDIRTNILFFQKGRPTKETWFYEVRPPSGERFTKTKPIQHSDFDGLREWWKNRGESECAWKTLVDNVSGPLFDLNIKNPHRPDLESALHLARTQRKESELALSDLHGRVAELLAATPGRLDEAVIALMQNLVSLGAQVGLTRGVVEDLRIKFTSLALQGLMSEPLPADESCTETLARLTPSSRRRHPNRLEPPFGIPRHWEWKELVDLVEFRIGRTPSTRDSSNWCLGGDDGVPFISISDMPRRGVVLEAARFITRAALKQSFMEGPIKPGTLMMAFKLSVGKTAFAGIHGVHNEAIASFDMADEIFKSYLLWALPALSQHAAKNPAVRGNTLNAKSIAGLWVPVPPREEQERLIAALKWVTELVEGVSEAYASLRDASESELKVLLAISTSDLEHPRI